MRQLALVVVCLFANVFVTSLKAQGVAEGYIVIHDKIPIYQDADKDKLAGYAGPGDSFVGITTEGGNMLGLGGWRVKTGASGGWVAQERNGRLHVLVIPTGGPMLGESIKVWVNKTDVEEFDYPCGCGEFDKNADRQDPCSPLAAATYKTVKWNRCFEKARDDKRAALKLGNASGATTAQAVNPKTADTPEERLKKLDDLYKKKLITKEEYEKKRAEILKSL